MKHFSAISKIFIILCLIIRSFGCASVPKEIVELSYRTGEDMVALYKSYDKLIQNYYGKMRDERVAYLNDVWYQRFLKDWMERGELAAIAKGEKIWSDKETKLILTPPGSDPQETLRSLRSWIDYALYAYELKEESLLKSFDEDEKKLRKSVEAAFLQIIKANAAITAHLNSLRKVKEVQDEALELLNIKDLRDQINNALYEASDIAAEGLERIQQADNDTDNLVKQVNSLKNNQKKINK